MYAKKRMNDHARHATGLGRGLPVPCRENLHFRRKKNVVQEEIYVNSKHMRRYPASLYTIIIVYTNSVKSFF